MARATALLLAFAASAYALSAPVNKGCYSSAQPLTKQDTFQYQSSGHCAPLCAGLGHSVIGMTIGSDCYCGDQLPPASSLVDDSNCNDPCNGYNQEKCGGTGFFTVWTSGLTDTVTNYAASPDSSSSSSSSSSSTSTTTSSPSSGTTNTSPSTVTSVSPGNTVVVTVSASASNTNTSSAGSSSGTSVAGVAAGVVVGVVAVAGIIGGVFFWLRHRRRQQAEQDYKRSAQVADFMRGASERKAPNTAYSNMSDSRLDPEMGRRNSVGSMADDHDYSRRILRVANPDSH